MTILHFHRASQSSMIGMSADFLVSRPMLSEHRQQSKEALEGELHRGRKDTRCQTLVSRDLEFVREPSHATTLRDVLRSTCEISLANLFGVETPQQFDEINHDQSAIRQLNLREREREKEKEKNESY